MMVGNCSGSTFRGSRFKPALVRRNVRFKTALLSTMPKDSMKSTVNQVWARG